MKVLLIGGSPCQDFSIAKAASGNRSGLKGDKSKLFYEYLRLFKEINPTNFLLENVKMKNQSENSLTEYLGYSPININSNLVSYQNRNRLYWTNIKNVTVPEDRHINFQFYKDTDKEYCDRFKVKRTPSRELMWGNGIKGKCPNVTNRSKINCLTRKQDRWSNSGLVEHNDFCRYLTRRELEQAQTVPIGYTDCLTNNQAQDLLGDGWTVDTIVHILSFMETKHFDIVVSLFDGMSCGQIALNKLGITYDYYFASEIKPFAIKCTQANYPNTTQIGDVTKVKWVDILQMIKEVAK